jgi:hypothetical protein
MIDKVTVIRYIRKDSEIWEDSNLGGATVVFELDYNTRKVKAAVSVCSEDDNFNKKLGIETAMRRLNANEQCIEFPLDYVDHFQGLVNAFRVRVLEDYIEAEQTEKIANVPDTIARAVLLREYYDELEEYWESTYVM